MLLNCGVREDLEGALDCEELQPIQPKGDQSWVFIGRTDVEAETPILWPHDVNWLTGKAPDAGNDWGPEEKGMTEDEMVRWHHRLNGHGFGWTPGVDDGQGGLVCCGSWGRKESDTTEQLNWLTTFDTDQTIKIVPNKNRFFLMAVCYLNLGGGFLKKYLVCQNLYNL